MESTDQIVFPDDVVIDKIKSPMFYKKMVEMQKPGDQRDQLTAAQSIQCMYETTEWLFDSVDSLNIKDKDILIVIGPSRAGKGTLLTALKGVEMKFFKKGDIKDTAIAKEISTQYFMAPKN